MSKLKLHARRELSYDPQTTGIVWTECFRHVDASRIAAFTPEGVTCKNCLAILTWREENRWVGPPRKDTEDAIRRLS